MNIVLARPRGFCSGAVRAIRIVQKALTQFGPPIFVLHEIVHNGHVLKDLKEKGAIFVEQIEDIPVNAVTVFSAHGVSTAVIRAAEKRMLQVIDATCPLITKVHSLVMRYSRQRNEVVIIGHSGHPEVEGVRGRIEGPVHVVSSIEDVAAIQVRKPESVVYVTQTTLGVEDTRQIIAALKKRFNIKGPDGSNICHATQARQKSIRCLARSIDLLLVVGARNSSNSNRLREIGEQSGVTSYLIEGPEDLNPSWFEKDLRVGITAGASAPEQVVLTVLERLRSFHPCSVNESTGMRERLFLPKKISSNKNRTTKKENCPGFKLR